MLLAVLRFPSFYLYFWLWELDVINSRRFQQYRKNRIEKLKLPVFHIVQVTPWPKVHSVNFTRVFVIGVPQVNTVECWVHLLPKSILLKIKPQSNEAVRCSQIHAALRFPSVSNSGGLLPLKDLLLQMHTDTAEFRSQNSEVKIALCLTLR